MFYNYYRDDSSEYNECNARGACSIAPKISSLQEVLIIFLRQLSFYALMLDKFGEDISQISANIVESLSTLVSTTDYTDEQLLGLVGKQYAFLIKTKRQYLNICKQKKISCEELKFGLDITPQMTLAGIISQGEKIFLNKYNKMSVQQKNMYEILLSVLKSVSLNIVKLKENRGSDSEAEIEVLKGLDTLNSGRISLTKIKNKIKELVNIDERVLNELYEAQKLQYGKPLETIVSHSTNAGKAILVSGGSLSELYALLKTAEKSDIDIYTHGDLLIAHTFENFRKFPSLKGHYGNCSDKCILDFATFPGAILLTKNSSQNLEYLYRGRLFTTEVFKPKGVVQILNSDFTPVIESANESKGFAKGQKRESEKVGFDEEILHEKLSEIAEKFNNKDIEKLVIVGISNYSKQQELYFKNLFAHLPDKTFVISFSYIFNYPDILRINVVNNLALAYSVLRYLFDKVPSDSKRVSFFLTKCDACSISKIIELKENGAKNIFLSHCPPNVINPSVLSTLEKTYGIRTTTSPEADAKKI